MKPVIDNAMDIIGSIEQANMDGVYQSLDNIEYGETNEIDIFFTGIQGAKNNFEFVKTDGGLLVLAKTTDTATEASRIQERPLYDQTTVWKVALFQAQTNRVFRTA